MNLRRWKHNFVKNPLSIDFRTIQTKSLTMGVLSMETTSGTYFHDTCNAGRELLNLKALMAAKLIYLIFRGNPFLS